MDPKLLEVRRRLASDFPLYSNHCLTIRTKNGDLLPFKCNQAQLTLWAEVERQRKERGFVRIIILKGRQQGLSTAVGGMLYQSVTHRKGAKALVLAHKAESSAALFEMVQRYHSCAPAIVKPSTKYASRRELFFDQLDSGYLVMTAGGEAIGRGYTFTHVHASEVAFWPKSSARDIWNGLTKSVGRVPGTEVYVESTANGVSNLFYDLWHAAVDGKNDYSPVFIPWFWEPGYRADPPEHFSRTMEEDELSALYGLDDAQLYWRRLQIGETSKDQFKQEYPCTPEEAFLASGMPVFNPEQLARLLAEAEDPDHYPRLTLEGADWQRHPRGELVQFIPYEQGEDYVIGADVAAGVRGGDWSVAQVLDSKKRQVAILRCQVVPDYWAEMLLALATHYNTALLCVENNNHGQLTCYRLSKEFNYPNLMSTVQYDKEQDKETVVVGFTTNLKTRPLILDQLRADMRDGTITLYDKITLREMQTFIVNETGKMEAEEGCFDDCVMSLAIANYNHAGISSPIVNEDDYYSDVVF